jgi:hypothetical protein
MKEIRTALKEFSQKCEGKNHFGDQSIDGNTALIWISKK